MIYELRTHTIRPGSERIVVDAANSLVEIRGDKFGKLEGYWTSETGHLNQVVQLWSYPDRNERQRLRNELAKDERWNDEFLPMVLDHISRYEIRLLETIAPFNPPATDGNIYTLRTFQTLAGQVGKWIKLFQGILPVREKYSKNVGAWATDASLPDETCLMYSYPTIDAFTECHDQMVADPDWNRYVEESSQLLLNRYLTFLMPISVSPMK